MKTVPCSACDGAGSWKITVDAHYQAGMSYPCAACAGTGQETLEQLRERREVTKACLKRISEAIAKLEE